MGISHADLLFIEAVSASPPRRVCDLGDQDLVCEDREILVFGASPFGTRELGSKTRNFWQAVGAEYVALDMFGDCVRFDLNTERVPSEWKRFDLVMNGGTSEHVMNQVNCFTVMHDLCEVGGMIYHQVPIGGYAIHGFFNYNVKFFRALARMNGYEILNERIDFADSNEGPFPDARMACPDASLRILLGKRRARPFRVPLDIPLTPAERAVRRARFMAGTALRRFRSLISS